MEIFKLSEFDLQRTVLSIPPLAGFFGVLPLFHRHRANTASDSISVTVTFPCQVGWKFLITIYALISCVNTINKTCHGIVKDM